MAKPLRILLLVHNHIDRGSWFRAMEIGRRLARRGHFVQLSHTSEHLLYRPVYRLMDTEATGLGEGVLAERRRRFEPGEALAPPEPDAVGADGGGTVEAGDDIDTEKGVQAVEWDVSGAGQAPARVGAPARVPAERAAPEPAPAASTSADDARTLVFRRPAEAGAADTVRMPAARPSRAAERATRAARAAQPPKPRPAPRADTDTAEMPRVTPAASGGMGAGDGDGDDDGGPSEEQYGPAPRPRPFVWAECPRATFFTSPQEGWSIPGLFTRLRDATASPWDIVYGFSHKPDSSLPALAARRFRGAKVVMDWSDAWGGPEGLFARAVLPSDAFRALPAPWRAARRLAFAAEAWWEPRAIARADAVTLISEEFLDHPAAPRGIRSRTFIMPSGAPLDSIMPLPSPAGARAVLRREGGAIGPGVAAAVDSIPRGALVVGYIANFHPDERLLMQAFARVCDARTDVHLLLAGADLEKSDPDLHARTKGRVHHLGRIPFHAVGEVLAAADVLVLPLGNILLNRVRYPHKLGDYLAAGRPVVACDVGATGRLLRLMGVGRLTPPGPAGLAAGLLEVLGLHGEARATLGAASRQAAEEHLDWDRLCGTLFDFLGRRLELDI